MELKLMEQRQLARMRIPTQCQAKVRADKRSRAASWDASSKMWELGTITENPRMAIVLPANQREEM
jgi:hypothetical protein